MKSFKVNASYSTYVHAVIEAENLEQAYAKAKELDGGDFIDSGDVGGWDIYEVEEIKPSYYYCFEMYKYGDGIESPCFEEETGHSISEARAKILKHYPKACILNEYKQVIEGDE